jgi:hypothetical protein
MTRTYQVEDQIVGRLRYKGDVRQAQTMVYSSLKYGPVVNYAAQYDEATDTTTVEFARVIEVES